MCSTDPECEGSIWVLGVHLRERNANGSDDVDVDDDDDDDRSTRFEMEDE
jgi:hypothetical protein